MEDIIHRAFVDELEKISKVGLGPYPRRTPKPPGALTARKPKKIKALKPAAPAAPAAPTAPLAEVSQAAPVPGPAYEGL